MKLIDIFIEFGLFILIVVLTVSQFVAPFIYKACTDCKKPLKPLTLLEHDYAIQF